jgi:hypothetical protein
LLIVDVQEDLLFVDESGDPVELGVWTTSRLKELDPTRGSGSKPRPPVFLDPVAVD